jgi:hypothetical protein
MTNNNGWIRIHRQILEWEWYNDINCFRVFTHLIIKANYKEKRYKGIELKEGSIITSRDLLAQETGLSPQQIRTTLTKLKSTNEITIETSSKGTIIQVVNYTKYQIPTNELTDEQPTNNQRVTTNKKDNKEKKFIAPTYNDVLGFCMQNNLEIDVNKFINFYESKGWMVGKNKMKDWKAAVRNWVKPQQEKPKFEDLDPLVRKAIEQGYIKYPQ